MFAHIDPPVDPLAGLEHVVVVVPKDGNIGVAQCIGDEHRQG
jgi:hypothetical protein